MHDMRYIIGALDIRELKKLIKDSNAVLVLDEGQPSFVVLNYKAYRDLTEERGEKEIPINHPTANASSLNGYSYHERETDILERLNKEILALKNQIETEEKGMNSRD